MTVAVALLLVVVEAGALLALAGALVVEAVSDWERFPAGALGLVLAFGAFAVLLLGAAWAVRRGKRWGRAPLLTWQAITIAIGISQHDLLGPWWVVVVVLPLVAGALLLTTVSREWTGGDGARGPADGD